MTEPWKMKPLDEWSIVGMNHCHVDGQKRLFVAMTKDGRCITEEGADDEYLWNRLWHKASTRSVEMLTSEEQDLIIGAIPLQALPAARDDISRVSREVARWMNRDNIFPPYVENENAQGIETVLLKHFNLPREREAKGQQ